MEVGVALLDEGAAGLSERVGAHRLAEDLVLAEQDGAKVGMHSVYVVHFAEAAAGPAPADFKQIYAKYGTPELSPLKIEVKKATNNLEIKLD